MSAGESLRAFVAVALPEPVLRALAEFQRQLKPKFRDVSWTRPEAMHLTLRFLGNIGVEQGPELAARLEKATKDHSPFELALSEPGTFGGRVLWMGLAGDTAALTSLAEAIRGACDGFGTNDETRAFNAHITLGRLRQSERRATRLLSEVSPPPVVSWRVAEFQLIRSELHPSGSRYTTLHSFRLASAAA